MPQAIIATPLGYSAVTQPYDFGGGICIRELAPIRWDVAIVKSEVSERGREELAKTKYWVCAANEYEHVYGSVGDELFERAHDAAMALQIICPTGAQHVFLKFHETTAGWDNVASSPPDKPLCSTLLGRITHLEDQGLKQHFNPVYRGIRRANESKIVRLQNPALLLEHGMQLGHAPLSTMLFVMGLDVLFMAGESNRFIERVGGFLGTDTLIFPPDSLMGYQPNTTVDAVLNDLYDFRNIVAHGQEIPKIPYREHRAITSTEGHQINHDPLCYVDILLEAAVFLLTTCLRKVFTEGLSDEVADPAQWRRRSPSTSTGTKKQADPMRARRAADEREGPSE